MTGLDGLIGLFNLKWFYDSMILYSLTISILLSISTVFVALEGSNNICERIHWKWKTFYEILCLLS